MEFWLVLILVIIGTAAIPLICVAAKAWNKEADYSKYDERQQDIQGKAAKLAMWVAVTYFVVFFFVFFIISIAVDEKTMTVQEASLPPQSVMILSLTGFLSVSLVYAVYCSMQGAFLPFRQIKPLPIGIIFTLSGVLHFVGIVYNALKYGVAFVPAYDEVVDMLFGVWSLYYGMLYLLQARRSKKE